MPVTGTRPSALRFYLELVLGGFCGEQFCREAIFELIQEGVRNMGFIVDDKITYFSAFRIV